MGLINMYTFWIIPWIELIAGILHIILWIIFVAVLVTLAPKHSAHWVFLEKSNMSGWTDDFISFNLGMILVTWGFVGKYTQYYPLPISYCQASMEQSICPRRCVKQDILYQEQCSGLSALMRPLHLAWF